MTASRSPTLRLRAAGPLACFTRPELKVERVSYPVMTPSAARGLLEAVLWKPAIRWHVERIEVLKPIRFTSFRRNEVNSMARSPSRADLRSYFAEDDRAQRNTVALRDVDYVIHAHVSMTDKAGPDDTMNKFVAMFERRVAKGQHFHQPYFGCREFVARVMPADAAGEPIAESGDLGIMLWDIDYGAAGNRPLFFRAELRNGVLEVPADPEVTLAGIGGEAGGGT
ncbi:MAG: type I-C CRISPR-associated protein Cas5 [Candidatus Brocadiaceae bacterium]|nr:type I-C CRISPR-associated protein Cas5 [Candidatus Brocadiaceae bacterium]